ncbi:ralBP1-associated Eps domain-containing protein 2 [Agrilus planipennis]|uniref:RalBP1-associated Eps domain-containing protein 2 n=1 Tax=Agrilus planipennis TaxID=224129 RepID=A0A1W4X6F7_AGRPL|nr:ralBP1-associated Eps domain-containing protein 2 [Agrilus planipennis]
MEDLQLSDTLQRYFSDFFVCCDEEKIGKVHVNKAIELIRSGNVPHDVVTQICSMCWGPNINFLNKIHFFSALKLVAAYQAKIPLSNELITASLELPLPRFTWPNSENHSPLNDLIEIDPNEKYREHTDTTSTDSEVESSDLNTNTLRGSPEISSTASDSPTPTNSVQDKSWAVSGNWQGLVSEEQRQLLGTEEESSDRHSSDDDTEITSEVWTITQEQREYYTAQFRSLQPDTNALLAGQIARLYFEKSRLPVQELRKIWQLADITKDGALSLQEFLIAMHLVVLRRNHIDLPDTLPPQLIPGNETPKSASPDQLDPLVKTKTKVNPKEWNEWTVFNVDSPPSNLPSPGHKQGVNYEGQVKGTIEQQTNSIIGHMTTQGNETPQSASPENNRESSKEWIVFYKSSPMQSLSSPGPKPVNFDFQKGALERDPKILHPKPLRLTPDNSNSQNDPGQQQDNQEGPSPKKFLDSVNLTSSSHLHNSQQQHNIIKGIQRPQPKKINIPGPGAIPPPPTLQAQQSDEGPISLPTFPPPKKEKPPPPPPRPFKSHGRSSSLDLNRLNKNILGAPPSVPPRVSPGVQNGKKLVNQRSEGDTCSSTLEQETNFANFDQFDNAEHYENVRDEIFPGDVYEAERKKLFAQFSITEGSRDSSCDAPRKHGAFEVYRKPKEQESPIDKEKWELFQKLQEENTVLLRLCQELSQELAEIREEKMTLKVRLEQQMKQSGG